MTQYRSRITVLLVLVLSAFLVHTVTTAEGQITGQTTQDITHLRLASSKPIASLDPADDDADPALVTQLFAGLTEIDPETFKPKPSLAHSWEVSEDGTVYTFFLRKDIRWSNGKPITSHDFVATLRKHLEVFEPSKDLLLLKNVQSLLDGELEDESLLGFQAVDNHILQFTLEHPAPLFPVIVSFLHYRPVPVQVIEEKEKAWTHPKNIVVSGPYTLQRWRKQKVLILIKNPMYFDAEKVQIAQISYIMLPSSQFALKMYKENALDIIPVSKRGQIAAISDMLGIREPLSEKPLLETWYLGFNQSRPPVDQPLVRKAIAMAIDKDFLLKKILRLMGHASNTFTAPPSFGAVNSKAEIGIPFNPEQGQQQLFEAGYENKKLPKIYISGPADVVLKPLKLMLERNLPIKVGLYGEDEEAGTPEDAHIFLSFKQAVYPDAYYFLSEFSSASSMEKLHWNNENYKKYTELINKAFRQRDLKQRKELYQKAEYILCQDEVAVIPLFYREIAFLATPRLQWTYSPTGTQQLWTWSFTAK